MTNLDNKQSSNGSDTESMRTHKEDDSAINMIYRADLSDILQSLKDAAKNASTEEAKEAAIEIANDLLKESLKERQPQEGANSLFEEPSTSCKIETKTIDKFTKLPSRKPAVSKRAVVKGALIAVAIGAITSAVSISQHSTQGVGNPAKWWQVAQITMAAEELSKSGKVEAALAKYIEALAINPDDDTTYRKMAEVYAFTTYQWNEAEQLVRQALLKDEKDTESLALLAYVQYCSNQKTEAKETIRKAFELKPGDQKIQALRGLILMSLGDKTGETVAEDAYRANRNNAEVARLLSLLFLNEAKDLNRAEELAREAVRLAPNNADFKNNLANVLIARQRFESAEEVLKEAAHDEVNNPIRWSRVGMFLIEQKREKEAIVFLKNAAELDSKNASRYMDLGKALLKVNRSSEAIVALKKAVELAPDTVAYRQELGDALYSAALYNAAAEVYQRIVKSAPGNTYAWHGLGWSKFMLGDYEAARASFLECVNREPKNPIYANAFALATANLKHFNEAAEWLLYSLSLESDQDDTWRKVKNVANIMRDGGSRSQASNFLWNALGYQSNSPARKDVESTATYF